MADARGNFAAATAQLRMYLISGDKVDKERFSGPWDNFERAFKAIDARKEALTASQNAAFEQVARAHREFAPLPNKMFSIRESEQWNMPVHLLRTEAAPRAARILELLEGPKSADGTRLGGIKSDQQRLLREEAQTVVDSISFLMRLEWLLLAIGMAIATTIALLTARSIVNPVQGMTKAMTALAAGDLNVVVPAQDKKDEVGEMAKAVLVFQEAAIEKGRMEQQAEKQRLEAIAHERSMVSNSVGTGMARLAAKDLTFRLKEDLPEAYRKLQNDFNHAMDQLEAALQNVRGGTNTISSGSDEISTASNNLSRRTEQQAAALDQTTAALREITETVHKTAVGARQAQDVVASAKSDAEQSGQVVQQAINAMGKIEKSSQQIGQIIGVIDEIAFQTNLLALNAGVEAARAGDAGRGFAVVASEVRALAQRSADAAKQIKSLISTSALEVGEGVKLVGETGAALERIVTEVSEINAVITEIAKSAQDQATGLQQVNTAVTELDQATQQNAAMAEQSTAASKSLADEGEQLARLVNEFQLSGTKSAQLRTELMKAAPHAFRENAPRSPAARSKPASASPSLTGTQQRLKPRAVAAAGSSESWEEF
jgi:methyl-accepting chemotaxis protein